MHAERDALLSALAGPGAIEAARQLLAGHDLTGPPDRLIDVLVRARRGDERPAVRVAEAWDRPMLHVGFGSLDLPRTRELEVHPDAWVREMAVRVREG